MTLIILTRNKNIFLNFLVKIDNVMHFQDEEEKMLILKFTLKHHVKDTNDCIKCNWTLYVIK